MSNQATMISMARHAATNADYVAYLLELYGRAEKLEWDAIAEYLGIDELKLARLALCRRPRKARFSEDTERMAGYANIEAPKLVALLRQAETLEAFQARSHKTKQHWLMAARDKDDESE